MLSKTLGHALIALSGFVVLGATAPETRAVEAEPIGGMHVVTAESLVKDYQAALLRTVTLRIAAGPHGAQPTVESAVAQICQHVSVPYQLQASRVYTDNKVAAAVAPMDLNGVVAADAIRAICASAGLEPQLDTHGVYLVLKTQPGADASASGPANPTQGQTPNQAAPSKPLSDLQRAQMGAALNVTARILLDKDTHKDKEVIGDLHRDGEEMTITTRTTRQQIQLEISMVTTRSLGSIRVKVTLYGYQHILVPEDARLRHVPSYDEERSPIVLHEEELPVGDMTPRRQRAGRSSIATAEYADTTYEAAWLVRVYSGNRSTTDQRSDRSGPFRSGTQYRDWILDVYSGDYLIKVLTSNRALFHDLGRDRTTGFPLRR